MDGGAPDGWRVAEWVGSALGGLGALFTVLLGWLGSYHVRRLDDTILRVQDVRENYVSRAEFLAHLARADKLTEAHHSESTQRLERIEGTIRDNAKEAKDDRHELRGALHTIGLQVATLVGQAQGRKEEAQR